jgi:predicted translin family RNA/ssDNA-binding protein
VGSVVAVHLLDLLDDAGVVVVVPLGESYPFLHLLEGVLEHLGELRRHILDPLLQVQDFVLFVLQFLVLLLFSERDGLVILF